MKYNPKIHHRRSIRLQGYDYSQAGAYFLTICCEDGLYRFGNIINGDMILNEYGQIAYNQWNKLPGRFLNMQLDVFQIMPNHLHGIIALNHAPVGATLAVVPDNVPVVPDIRAGLAPAPTANTVRNIVGAYKSLVANVCLEIHKSKNEMMGKLWQRNYYEHIIRNEQSYQTMSEYIINNPSKWKEDKF